MKQQSLGIKIVMLLITLVVLAYFGLQAALYFHNPLSTAVAYRYGVEEGVELAGVVIRSEQLLPQEDSGLLQLKRREGERVSAGGVVASLYTDEAALEREQEIEAVESRVEQLRFAREAELTAEAGLMLDTQIYRGLRELRTAVERDRLDMAEGSAAELRALVLKRDYSGASGEQLEAELQTLQARLKELKGQGKSSVRRITAPVSGLYSAVVDGYETVLTPQILESLTPSSLAAIEPDPAAASSLGKLVLGDQWYYAAVMKTEEAKALQDAGNSLHLRFGKGVEQELPVTLQSIGKEENGRSVAVFTGRSYLAELTLLRRQSAKIVSRKLSGIRVPKEALRAASRMLDRETGEEIHKEQSGVYCVLGREAVFKPVRVLYNGDGFLLVESTAEKESARLRPGDQVIVAAKELYDGKVVTK